MGLGADDRHLRSEHADRRGRVQAAGEPARHCDDWNPPHTSYSAHNPTLTPHIAFSTWHSGGFQAVSIQNAHRPYQLAEFFPDPLDEVMLEDPRLSDDPDTGRHEKVVMWSYPVIQDGLIYVIDLRNGLYVLRYGGDFAKEVAADLVPRGQLEPGQRALLRAGGHRPRLLPLRLTGPAGRLDRPVGHPPLSPTDAPTRPTAITEMVASFVLRGVIQLKPLAALVDLGVEQEPSGAGHVLCVDDAARLLVDREQVCAVGGRTARGRKSASTPRAPVAVS